ncbi:MAG TPA: hypothetical protein VF533_22760 [Solirubrobacteraceae bacterium]|jgi:hypothetical protein
MRERVFLSYEHLGHDALEDVARLVATTGYGISGRNFAPDKLFAVGSPHQQLQAASAALVLITADAEASATIAEEIEWAIEQSKGLVGLRLDPTAAIPRALFDAGAEVLDARRDDDVGYLPRAIDTAVQSAKLLEQAAIRGSGLGAPCARPTRRS